MRFYCLHYSVRKNNTLDDYFEIFPENQIISNESLQLSPPDDKKPSKKIEKKEVVELVEKILIEHRKYVPDRKNENTLLFGNLIINDETGELRAGRIGKEKTEEVPSYDEKDSIFEEDVQLQYPNVIFVWDRKRQMIAIERDKRKFPTEENLYKAIEKHINRYLIKIGWSAKINPIYTEETFWEIVDSKKKIKQIEFVIDMPNLFGLTNLPLKKYMDKLNQTTNAISLKSAIVNEIGGLKISKENKEIVEAVEWVNTAEGSWKIETDDDSYTSNQTIIYVPIKKQRKDVKNKEDIEEIIEIVGKKYDQETRK
ncbi:hypothetical protein MmiAt1_01020 [Methanimicrococcus sp. At1]|uniref:Uncharacterized protein n=1 Tax=Methanimicrococcus hacksteinii TaxID=3028293 RepID=A0ABU3VME7_9EURY|nr:hypothetical protein [Methanimicrococcus sp. At1]MDV0444574.1 hypothetical protein [Methanimicrococcus sp. At1]